MQQGKGLYDDLCEEIVHRTAARGVLLIVIEGNRGSEGDGMSLIGSPEIMEAVPDMLHGIANDLKEAQADEEEKRKGSAIFLPPGVQ